MDIALPTLTELIELACLMEATARKPGNVHPGASFSDLCYDDFVKGAAAIAPVLACSEQQPLGRTVFDAIIATQAQTATNLNLGIVLLLAPLAAVPPSVDINDGIGDVLKRTTQDDAALVYEAIRLAHPGGLGKVDDQDVADAPTQTLLEVMQLAADRDQVAAQYATDFRLVRSLAERFIQRIKPPYGRDPFPIKPLMPLWEHAVIGTYLELLTLVSDSLIARKEGIDVAQEAQRRASLVANSSWPMQLLSWEPFHELDAWLRADGHRRNPGTSADLIAAALFVALRDGRFEPPTKAELFAHATAIRVLAPRQ